MNKIINFINKNKEITVILLFIMLMVLVASLQFRRGNKEQQPVYDTTFKVDTTQKEPVSWESITPGVTNYADVETKFSGFQERVLENNLIVYKYADWNNGNNFVIANNVATDQNGLIKYLEVKIHPLKKLTLPVYESKFNLGEPSLKLAIDNSSIINYTAYVYLNRGIMLYVSDETQSVSHEVYFEPSTEAQFMSIWRNKLQAGHEELPY